MALWSALVHLTRAQLIGNELKEVTVLPCGWAGRLAACEPTKDGIACILPRLSCCRA
jgi:hypothetical protein